MLQFARSLQGDGPNAMHLGGALYDPIRTAMSMPKKWLICAVSPAREAKPVQRSQRSCHAEIQVFFQNADRDNKAFRNFMTEGR